MPEPSPRSARIGAPPNDASDLDDKKRELATISAQVSDATARAAGLAAEIKIIEARIAEVKKATDAYGLGSTAQQAELDDAQKLIGQKWTMAVAGVKDQKDAVDRIVKSVDDDLAAQPAKLTSNQRSADKARQEWESAVADTKTKQETYAALQQVQKDTDAKLKQVKALIDQASKAEAQADIASMYFLLQEASEAAKNVSVLSPDEYASKVKGAQADAEASKATLANRKVIFDQQTKQLTGMQAEVAASIAARRTTILSKLKDTEMAAPVAVPAKVPPAPAASPSTPDTP